MTDSAIPVIVRESGRSRTLCISIYSQRSGILDARMRVRALDAPPFRAHALITLGADLVRCKRLKRLRRHQLRQRPNRGAADQRALILEQALRLASQGGVIGVTDRDQHVADKSIAADALDRRFRE